MSVIALTAGLAVALAAGALWSQQRPVPSCRVSAWTALVERRRERDLARQLPVLLEGVARGIRSGLSITVALARASPRAGPLAADVGRVVDDIERGTAVAAALDAWAARRERVPGVRLTTSALALAGESGGAIAQTVDGVADTLRGELALAAEVRSLAAQAEASAVIIAVLPLAFGAIAGATDPRTIDFLTSPPLGPACLATGLTLDGLGFWWLRAITRSIR